MWRNKIGKIIICMLTKSHDIKDFESSVSFQKEMKGVELAEFGCILWFFRFCYVTCSTFLWCSRGVIWESAAVTKPTYILSTTALDFPHGIAVKNPIVMQEPQKMVVQSLDWEDPLEKSMTTHSSILVWRIPWTEEPSELRYTSH